MESPDGTRKEGEDEDRGDKGIEKDMREKKQEEKDKDEILKRQEEGDKNHLELEEEQAGSR